MLSSEYSWTTEHILGLTMREVNWRIERIVDRNSTKMEYEAILHDKKVNKRIKKAVENMTMSEEKELLIEKAQREAQKRISNGKR